jgi:hypothetical protein
MSPWEEMEYFQAPVVTPVSCPTGTTIVVDVDPMRTVLMFANPTSITLFGVPGRIAPSFPASVGVPLSNDKSPLIMTQADYGPLVQYDWCVQNSSATTVILLVTTIRLKLWPRTYPRS